MLDYLGRTPQEVLDVMEKENTPDEIDQIIADNWASSELAGQDQEVEFWKEVYLLNGGEDF